MADNDNMRGRGRGIGRGKGRGRGRGTAILSQPSIGQPTHPSTATQPSTSQIPPASQGFTPNPHISTPESPHIRSTPSPSPTPTNVASSDSPHVGSSSAVTSPQIGSMDPEGRVWIRPGPNKS